MRQLVLIILICLVSSSAVAQTPMRMLIPKKAAAGGGGGPYAFEQQTENSDNATGSGSITAPALTVTAGNLLIVLVSYDRIAGATTVTPTGNGNTYTELATGIYDASQYGMRAFYSYNSASGSTSVLATFGATVNYPAIYVAEFSGIRSASDPLTGTPVFNQQDAPGTGTDGLTSTNITPGGQPALLFGFGFDVFGATPAPTAGTGFTSLTAVWDYDAAIAVSARPEHKRLTSTSAVPALETAGVDERHFTFGAVFLEP